MLLCHLQKVRKGFGERSVPQVVSMKTIKQEITRLQHKNMPSYELRTESYSGVIKRRKRLPSETNKHENNQKI